MNNQSPSVPTEEVVDMAPFKRLVMTIGTLPTAFTESLTYYEALAYFVKYLEETVIPAVNQNAAATKELQDLFIELKSYVDNYFENLDVQEEINNKLDEMAEDGTLAEIVTAYLNAKSILAYNTISDMAEATNLIDGSFARCYGKDTYNDGKGRYYKIREIRNTDVIDGYNLVALTNFENLVAEISPEQVFTDIDNIETELQDLSIFTTIEEHKLPDDVDDTNALELAIADGRPIYLQGTYTISRPVDITTNTVIIGKSMTDTVITYTGTTSPLFNLVSEVSAERSDTKTNVKMRNFKFIGKSFIRINDNTVSNAQWEYQTSYLTLMFDNLWLHGTYDSTQDANADTNVLPSVSDLLGYGYGFNCNSMFDSSITNCRIEAFGTAIYFKGCDINLIENNRLNHNANNICLERISTYGSQNRICHNDILRNFRAGSIRIIRNRWDSIVDNYFENYTASAIYIYADREHGLLIDGNRFDTPTNDTDIIKLAPVFTDIVVNNRVNPSSAKTYVTVDHQYFDFIYLKTKTTAYIRNNSEGLRINDGNNVGVGVNSIKFNPLKISPYNLSDTNQSIGGSGFTTPYFPYDSNKSLYYFHNTTQGSIVYVFGSLDVLYGRPTKIRILASNTSTSASNMYVQVQGDSVIKHGDNHSIPANDVLTSVEIDLTSNGEIYNTVRIEIPTSSSGTIKVFSIELL